MKKWPVILLLGKSLGYSAPLAALLTYALCFPIILRLVTQSKAMENRDSTGKPRNECLREEKRRRNHTHLPRRRKGREEWGSFLNGRVPISPTERTGSGADMGNVYQAAAERKEVLDKAAK